MTEIAKCPNKSACKAETCFGTGVTECNCGLIGWLGWDGQLYSDPNVAAATNPRTGEEQR